MKYRLQALTAIGAKQFAAGVDFTDKGAALSNLTFIAVNGLTPTVKTVTVKVAGDVAVEGDETMRLTVSAVTGPARLARPIGIGTIVDDDAASGTRISIGSPAVTEGDAGSARLLRFPVTLSAPSATAITLSYRVTGGSATQTAQASGGGDIGGKAAGAVRFVLTRTGTTAVQKSINLPVWSDTVAESDDTVDVTLSADALPPGVSISHATGTGTVLDDDAPVTSVPVPNSMAALGDSFSRGYNACSSAGDCTGVSWSTGTDPGVDSHYTRILDVNPAIAGHNNTDAMDGAPMASLDSQAQQAVSQNVDYVTIEIGGADICKSDESLMTPASAFQAQFQQAMTTLTSGLPNARVFVASIPDFMRTWEIAKDLPAARTAWASFQSFCATVTANPLVTDQANTDRRQRVRQRESDFNTALATVCAQFSNCRFDDDAVFNWKYSLSDLSTLDYFHPSYAWQTGLGALTYSAGFDW